MESESQTPPLRLVTLGVPRLDALDERGSSAHSTGPGKPLALITFLAFALRRTTTRDTICEVLWGDRTIDQARTALRQTLWLIKTQIHRELLNATASDIALSRPLASDADEFVAAIEANDLARAVGLYAGDFFTGYAAPGAGRFEEWASLERTRFRALFVNAAEALARHAMDGGRFSVAISLASRLRSVDPNGQVGWRILLEARIASGDLIGARADADHFEDWLRQEEWHPEPASRAVLQLARRETTAAQSAADSTALVAELVGREKDFAAIHDAWVTAKTKGARTVHIVAESGLGKTRLVRDIVARIRAARGRARYIRANFGEREIPFSFAAAIAKRLAAAPGASGVAPAAARTLVALDPSLSATFSDSATSIERLESLRVGLALLELITSIADEEPIAIALDDLHWCDSSSREALKIVEARLSTQNVLLMTTARAHYSVGPVRPDCLQIRLAPLDEAQIAALIASLARLPEEPWAQELPARLRTLSEGSPLQVLEALRYCLDIGLISRDDRWHCRDPEALKLALEQAATLNRRLATLSGTEMSILRFLGIGGMPIPRNMITEAVGIPAREVDDAAANLELRGLLVREEESWASAHDAIAEAVVDEADATMITAAHAQLGAAMAAAGDSRWKTRAIPHLVEGNQWKEAAKNISPLLRYGVLTSRRVDEQLGQLLGSAANEIAVTRVKRELPLLIRHPAFLRQTLVGAVVLIALAIVAGSRLSREPGVSDAMLVVLTRDQQGNTQAQNVRLDLDRWDASSAMPLEPPRPASELNGPVPRPGSESWAVSSIYPDSGETEIDLIDGGGRRVRLTYARGHDRPSQFSPDGKQLVFLTTRWNPTGWSDIAVLDLNSGSVRRITFGGGTYAAAYWSPDGTRIAFTRDPLSRGGREICTVDVSGFHSQCHSLPGWRVTGQVGWLDGHRFLISADSSQLMSVWLAFDADDGTAIASSFPPRSAVSLDPTGKWALVGASVNNRHVVRVSPSGRFDLARLVIQDTMQLKEIRFASPRLSDSFLDRVAIHHPTEPLAPRIPHQLIALGWSKSGRSFLPGRIRWRSLSPSVARVDSLGVLIAQTSGTAIIELSAGGWRTKRDTLRISSVPISTSVDENWDARAFERWRVFGDPKPMVLKAKNATVFYNNGDGNFFSGAYLLKSIDARRGVAMDFELSTPITRTQWQVILAGLNIVRDTTTLKKWDHRSGYLAPFLDNPSCWFVYPVGEGEDATTHSDWFPSLRAAVADSTYRLDTGAWYRVRLQIFPDGRCGTAINGHALIIQRGNSPPIDFPVYPIVQGSSVGTRVLVGRVVVRSGVPTDIDWSGLRFTGSEWEHPRIRPNR